LAGAGSAPINDLNARIAALCDLLNRTHYYEEARSLQVARRAPNGCNSAEQRQAVLEAARVALELGFADVAAWLVKAVLATRRAAENGRIGPA
jgi:hypothetical protein